MVLFGKKTSSKEDKKEFEQFKKLKAQQYKEDQHTKLKAEQEEIEEVFDQGLNGTPDSTSQDLNSGYYDELVKLIEGWLETEKPKEIILELKRLEIELMKFIINEK